MSKAASTTLECLDKIEKVLVVIEGLARGGDGGVLRELESMLIGDPHKMKLPFDSREVRLVLEVSYSTLLPANLLPPNANLPLELVFSEKRRTDRWKWK